MTDVNGFFLAVLVAALGLFSFNVQRLIGYLRLGRLDDTRWNDVPRRVGNFLRIGIFQEKIFRDSVAGPMHALIFWGFMILGASTTEMLIGGVFPGFGYDRFLPEPLFRLYVLSQEGFAAIVLAMIAFALWRRLTKQVKRLEGAETHPNDPLLILSWIAALMLTMYEDDAVLRQAMQAGAKGYVVKGAYLTELIEGIKLVASGSVYVHQAMMPALVRGLFADAPPPVAPAPDERPAAISRRRAAAGRVVAQAAGHSIRARSPRPPGPSSRCSQAPWRWQMSSTMLSPRPLPEPPLPGRR